MNEKMSGLNICNGMYGKWLCTRVSNLFTLWQIMLHTLRCVDGKPTSSVPYSIVDFQSVTTDMVFENDKIKCRKIGYSILCDSFKLRLFQAVGKYGSLLCFHAKVHSMNFNYILFICTWNYATLSIIVVEMKYQYLWKLRTHSVIWSVIRVLFIT